jgi:hypothetical protein
MSESKEDLWRLSAVECIALLKAGQVLGVSPLVVRAVGVPCS